MAFGSPNPQLVLKTTPPRIPRTALDRSRLSGSRPEFADKSVIVLQAPGGYGKTSLLAQWRKESLQAGAVVAWLTLDAQDTDERVALGLTTAIRAGGARPDFGQGCVGASGANDRSLGEITEWLAEVADSMVETVLILDEVHTLPDSTLGLVDRLPAAQRTRQSQGRARLPQADRAAAA